MFDECVREERLELSQDLTYWNLNPARLPIPPLSHVCNLVPRREPKGADYRGNLLPKQCSV